MIRAERDDRLVGATLDNQGHWSKALQCLPEQGSTVQLEQGKVGTVLYHRLIGAMLDNQGRWGKA